MKIILLIVLLKSGLALESSISTVPIIILCSVIFSEALFFHLYVVCVQVTFVY